MAGSNIVIETSVLIEHLRARAKRKTLFLEALKVYDCYVSAITVYEIELGAQRSGRGSDLMDILPMVIVLPFGQQEAETAAQLDAMLTARNQVIGLRDLFIAATALVRGWPLCTKNVQHSQRIPDLHLVTA